MCKFSMQKSLLTCHTIKLPREVGSYREFTGVAQNNCGTGCGLTKYRQHCSQASCSLKHACMQRSNSVYLDAHTCGPAEQLKFDRQEVYEALKCGI